MDSKTKADKTRKGLKYLLIYQVTSMIFLVPVLALNIIYPTSDYASVLIGRNLSFFVVLGAVLLIFFLFSMALLVVEIIGLVQVYQGKDEFGKRHSANVRYGLILIVVSFVLTFVMAFAGGMMSFNGAILVQASLNHVAAVFMVLGSVYLILAIAQERARLMLWSGFWLQCSVLLVYFLLALLLSIGATGTMVVISAYVMVGILSLLSASLMVLAYYGTYKGIKEGTIRPGGRRKAAHE